MMALTDSKGEKPVLKSMFHIDIAGSEMIFMGSEFIIYFALLFILEKLRSKGTIDKILSREKNIQYIPKKYDPEV